MKLLLTILFFISLDAGAANYYVSASGSDGNNGTSTGSSWLSISKVNAQTFAAGDSILFRRGDTFYGALIPGQSGSAGNPIVYGSYGSGARPIITGFVTLSSWSSIGGGVYQSLCPACNLKDNMVIRDGVEQNIGRWPNTGYRTYQTFVSNTSITDASLTGTPNWTGGEVVIRKTDWIIDRNKITGHSTGTLTYTPASSYPGIANFGYFIQNDSLTLDTLGEWFLSPSLNMKMYFGGLNPASYTIKTSTIDTLVYLNGKSYITFDHIHLQGANIAALSLNGASNINFQNSSITYSGENAISFSGASAHDSILHCTVRYTNNNVLYRANVCTATYPVIMYDTVAYSGFIAGMGMSDDENYNAFSLFDVPHALYQYNKIDTVGYMGINFGGDATVVQNNAINYICFQKQDGAGIYSYTSGSGTDSVTFQQRIVKSNIVSNSIGAPVGTPFAYPVQANGIYMDNYSSQVTVDSNTEIGCANNAVTLNCAHNVSVTNNISYLNNGEVNIISQNAQPSYNLTICKNTTVRTAKVSTIQNNTNVVAVNNRDVYLDLPGTYTSVGVLDSNYYYTPSDSSFLLSNRVLFNGAPALPFSSWKSATAFDAHSHQLGAYSAFLYNATLSNIAIPLAATYIDGAGVVYNNSLTIHPFQSYILTIVPGQFVLLPYSIQIR